MIRQLAPRDAPAVRDVLSKAPLVNLFLLHCLEADGLERSVWCGRWLGKDLVALAYLVPGRLFVPWASSSDHAAPLGEWFRKRYVPCLMVGPRGPCDAIWRSWTQNAHPAVWYDQRLYMIDRIDDLARVDCFRLARDDDWPTLAEHSAAYASEDLGEHAPDSDPEALTHVVRERIKDRRTYVMERDGQLVFHVHVGANGSHGCMVGGTYVPPKWRRQGVATQGMRQVTRALLQRWPTVTLHVNEANTGAVRVYQNTGFTSHAAYRLAMPAPSI